MRSLFYRYFLLSLGVLLVGLTVHPVAALPPTKSLSQFLIRHWRQSDGLPHNSVSAITQTADGALWIGTHNGLVRFDGLEFERFYKKNDEKSLRSNRVETLLRMPNGGLWIGTLGGGLTQVRQGRFRSFTTKEGLPDDAVLALANSGKKIWVGTTFGLAMWNGSGWERFRRQDGLLSERVRALACSPDPSKKKVWIGTQAGLFVYQNETIRSAAIPLPDPTVTALLPVGDSLLLIGTRQGLIRHDLRSGTQTQIGKANFRITCLYQDGFGAYWIGTRQHGLHRYYQGKLETLDGTNGLPDNYVHSIFEDREGGLWVGVDRGGLIRLWEGKFQNYGTSEGLTPGEANCVTEGSKGSIWTGTPQGLFRKKNGVFRAFLPEKTILSLDYDARPQTLWVGTQNRGLWRRRGEAGFMKVPTPDWVGTKVSAVHTRRAGHLWLAGERGVGYWQEGVFHKVLSSADIFDTEVNALYEASDTTLWIATNGGGIHAYRPDGTILPFSTLDNLPSNIAFCFQEMQDAGGSFMLIGTASGLARLRSGNIEDLSLRDPVLSNSIYGLAVRDRKEVWMTSNRGVIRFPFNELNDTSSTALNYTRYDDGDGMRSSDCAFGTPPTLLKDRAGFLWIPTAKGLSQLNTHEIPLNEKPPLLVVHTLKVDGKSYDIRVSREHSLVFHSDKDRFEFYFDAFSFEAPSKIQVRYRLQGFETEWHEAIGIRQATYTNLPPGSYIFQFTAANSDGIWNLDEAERKVVIKPFFYETWWFAALVVFFLLLVAYLIYYIRTRQLERQREKLEALVAQRTEEVISQDRELRQRNEEIARVDKIAHIINQEVEFEQLFYVLLEQGVQLFEGASRGFFAVFDQETFDFELVQHYGFGTGRAPLERIPFAPMMNYCHRGEVLKEEVYYIENIEGMTLFNLRPAEYSVAIPIKLEDTLEAMLFFEYDKPVELEGEYFRRLLRFKEHAVTAFEKSRRMKQIAEKNAALEGSFQKLSDSIQYAQRIQYAIMPSREKVENCFRDAFIMYRPRDVVSGDFYWAYKTEEKLFIAAIDCTGHGVPGAFMTVMANSIINNVVVERGIDDPAEILHAIDQKLEHVFSASTDTARRSDGMDMSFIRIDRNTRKLAFAGAKSPLYYIRDEEFFRIKGSKFPIGNSDRYKQKEFVTHHLSIQRDDRFYIFTDGLPDQFGGDEGGKFLTRRFRDLLLEFHHLSMCEQRDILEDAFERWKGENRQTDDVLVIGFQC